MKVYRGQEAHVQCNFRLPKTVSESFQVLPARFVGCFAYLGGGFGNKQVLDCYHVSSAQASRQFHNGVLDS